MVTCVDVSLGNRVDDIFGCVLRNFNIGGNLLDEEVVADELVIKNRRTELRAGALHTIGQLVIRSDGIIAIDDTLTFLIETTQQVEGIEGHEAARVQSVA